MLTQTKLPKGYHTVTPYITVADAQQLIDFARQAFGAEQTYCMNAPDGSVRHAELRIGDSMVMVGQARGEWTPRPSTLYLYVDDVDAVYAQAIAAGAKSLGEPKDQAYGDRSGGVEDSNGNYWWLATHVEDVPAEEFERRMKAAQ
jgi:PhnB protein